MAPSRQKKQGEKRVVSISAARDRSAIRKYIALAPEAYELLTGAQETVKGALETIKQLSKDNTTQHAGRDATAQAQLKVTAGALETIKGAQETMKQLSKDNTTQHAGRDATAQAQLKVIATALELAKVALAKNNPEAARLIPVAGDAAATNPVAGVAAARLNNNNDNEDI
jgi:hypothetical protein